MTRLTPEELLLANLREKVAKESMAYMTRDAAIVDCGNSPDKTLGVMLINGKSGLRKMGCPCEKHRLLISTMQPLNISCKDI